MTILDDFLNLPSVVDSMDKNDFCGKDLMEAPNVSKLPKYELTKEDIDELNKKATKCWGCRITPPICFNCPQNN